MGHNMLQKMDEKMAQMKTRLKEDNKITIKIQKGTYFPIFYLLVSPTHLDEEMVS